MEKKNGAMKARHCANGVRVYTDWPRISLKSDLNVLCWHCAWQCAVEGQDVSTAKSEFEKVYKCTCANLERREAVIRFRASANV